MGQFLQTNGDYAIKTREGGIVRLDVGPPSSGGQVVVTSDLIVEGDTLTVEAENLNVKDNIIQLNFGETGAGVSLRYSGLQIDRGTLEPASFFFDDNTRVIVTDKEVTGSLQYLIDNTGYSTFGESAVSVLIDNTLNTQFYSNRALIQGFELNQNEPGSPAITVNNTNDSIFLQTNGTGKLRTNYGLQLEQISVDPAYVPNSTIQFAKEPSIGDTGLFYRNTNNDTDELISKNKALLFSMIF